MAATPANVDVRTSVAKRPSAAAVVATGDARTIVAVDHGTR